MDEVQDLKLWFQKKEGEPLAVSYKLNVGILNVLWSVTCGRYLLMVYLWFKILSSKSMSLENYMLSSKSSKQSMNVLTK